MRIDKVYIEDYKNLKQFNIDIDENEMKTVLLGQNATGKSNFMEALILIFKYLDLEKEVPSKLNLKYSIEYRCRNYSIKVSNLTGKYEFDVMENLDVGIQVGQSPQTHSKISKTDFFKHKEDFLPKYVFAYYSGLSNKLNELFWDHQWVF
jgi:recombinational DNA repair ATPase RecF